MRKLIPLLIALPLLAASPALSQDLLGPIEDFVETLTDPPDQRQPAPRPEAETPPPVPRPRPPSLPDGPVVERPAPPVTAPAAEEEPAAEPEVEPEPERIYQVACPAVIMGLVEAEMAPPLREGICGEQSPLVVTGVMSRGRMVPLSSPMTTNCQMAGALPGWVETVDGYAETVLGSALAQIDAGTSYMCRNRNNAEAGFTSEHGFANAVDVTGFTLEDGRTIAVKADWPPAAAPEGRLLRLAHDAACSGFSTVLGPEANAEHEDHLHLDLGCHGARCMARICE
ncbi:extensin family protein [Devosia sp. Root635]|uniref:extensin-like domain-containing protein n=1 Tax=Devosia sp. Root635 TaxID=1736575 RepID=UPI0006FBD621|nr:extensin family protein [Devosia sp. Root635]